MIELRIRLGALVFAMFLLVAPCNVTAQEQDRSVALRIPNGWTKLPEWMEQELPFDASAYYGIDERRNREVPYLKAFLEIDYQSACDAIPDVELTPEFEARYAAARHKNDAFYELWDKHVEYRDDVGKRISINPEGVKALNKLMKEYDAGIELIRTAQQREHCFFHIEVDTASINAHQMMARQIAKILSVRCILNPGHDRAIDDVRMILQLKRDLQKLGRTVAQMSFYASEEICFNWMVLTVLENPDLQKDQLDELIDVLSEHYHGIQEIDPAIEAVRYEYMMLHNLLRQLETREYDARQRSKNQDLNQTLSEPGMVIHELTSLMVYEINTSELRRAITTLAQDVPEIAEILKQYDDIRNQIKKANGNAQQRFERQRAKKVIDSSALLPLLLNRLTSMTRNDYEKEVSILRSRCRQITEACQLGFPDSSNKLKVLGEQWTTDSEWEDSKILRWFRPTYNFSLLRIRSTLQTNAFLCLAATKKWQLENAGEKPKDLGQVMSAIGINTIPVDPYSGQALKMTVIDEEVVVYSVGPDGDDDHAREHYDIFDSSVLRKNDNNGDVVFRIVAKESMDQ